MNRRGLFRLLPLSLLGLVSRKSIAEEIPPTPDFDFADLDYDLEPSPWVVTTCGNMVGRDGRAVSKPHMPAWYPEHKKGEILPTRFSEGFRKGVIGDCERYELDMTEYESATICTATVKHLRGANVSCPLCHGAIHSDPTAILVSRDEALVE